MSYDPKTHKFINIDYVVDFQNIHFMIEYWLKSIYCEHSMRFYVIAFSICVELVCFWQYSNHFTTMSIPNKTHK